jgi:hypothetical protein
MRRGECVKRESETLRWDPSHLLFSLHMVAWASHHKFSTSAYHPSAAISGESLTTLLSHGFDVDSVFSLVRSAINIIRGTRTKPPTVTNDQSFSCIVVEARLRKNYLA